MSLLSNSKELQLRICDLWWTTGMLRFMGSQSQTWLSNWTELNWTGKSGEQRKGPFFTEEKRKLQRAVIRSPLEEVGSLQWLFNRLVTDCHKLAWGVASKENSFFFLLSSKIVTFFLLEMPNVSLPVGSATELELQGMMAPSSGLLSPF